MNQKQEAQETIERVGAIVHGIIRELVNDQAAVVFAATPVYSSEMARERDAAPSGVVFQVSVAREDMGKVIGKMGRTSRAIRALLIGISRKSDLTMQLDIVDERER